MVLFIFMGLKENSIDFIQKLIDSGHEVLSKNEVMICIQTRFNRTDRAENRIFFNYIVATKLLTFYGVNSHTKNNPYYKIEPQNLKKFELDAEYWQPIRKLKKEDNEELNE